MHQAYLWRPIIINYCQWDYEILISVQVLHVLVLHTFAFQSLCIIKRNWLWCLFSPPLLLPHTPCRLHPATKDCTPHHHETSPSVNRRESTATQSSKEGRLSWSSKDTWEESTAVALSTRTRTDTSVRTNNATIFRRRRWICPQMPHNSDQSRPYA